MFTRRLSSTWPVLVAGILIVIALALGAPNPQFAAADTSDDVRYLSLAEGQALFAQGGWTGDGSIFANVAAKTQTTAVDPCSITPGASYATLYVRQSPLGANWKELLFVYGTTDTRVDNKLDSGQPGKTLIFNKGCSQGVIVWGLRYQDGSWVAKGESGPATDRATATIPVVVGSTPTLPLPTSTPVAYPSPPPYPAPGVSSPTPTPVLPGFVGGRPVVWLRGGFRCPVYGYMAIPASARPAGFENARLQCAQADVTYAFVMP